MLQSAVLVFPALQTLCVLHFQPALLAFPGVDCRFADAGLTCEIRDFAARLVLLQDADDLLFAESALLHLGILLRRLSPKLRSSILRGRVYRRHVNTKQGWYRRESRTGRA